MAFDTEYQHVPVCPHCGSEHHDWWDGVPQSADDGSTWEVECESCEKPFKIEMHKNINFSTRGAAHAKGEDKF